MDIRKATTDDIEAIRRIARQSWAVTYGRILSEAQTNYMLEKMYSREEIMRHFEQPNYHYRIASEDGFLLGFIGYEHHFEPKTTKLHRIYLLPEAQGKGVGKKLVDLLKSETQTANDTRIILAVNKHNSARQFYEKLGFSVYEEGVFDIGEGFFMDDYLMQYHIIT